MIMASRVGAGVVRSGEGMLASPWVGERFPRARAMQASPPRSAPPPPLRDWMRLKTLHTRIHKKPTPEGGGGADAGRGCLHRPRWEHATPARAMQASPPRSAPPPPLRDWMRLKTLHTRIHKKPTPEGGGGADAGRGCLHRPRWEHATPARAM